MSHVFGFLNRIKKLGDGPVDARRYLIRLVEGDKIPDNAFFVCRAGAWEGGGTYWEVLNR